MACCNLGALVASPRKELKASPKQPETTHKNRELYVPSPRMKVSEQQVEKKTVDAPSWRVLEFGSGWRFP